MPAFGLGCDGGWEYPIFPRRWRDIVALHAVESSSGAPCRGLLVAALWHPTEAPSAVHLPNLECLVRAPHNRWSDDLSFRECRLLQNLRKGVRKLRLP